MVFAAVVALVLDGSVNVVSSWCGSGWEVVVLAVKVLDGGNG